MYEKTRGVRTDLGGFWDTVSQIGGAVGSGLTAAVSYGQQQQQPAGGGSGGAVYVAPRKSALEKALPFALGGAALLGAVYFITRKK